MILSIDASTTKTGYGLIDGNQVLYGYGLIEPHLDNVYDRFQYIYNFLEDYILKNSVDIIIVEDVPINSRNNLKVAKDLCILQGIILGLCTQYKIPFYNYSPTAWRSVIGLYDGNNEGKKRDVQKQRAVDYINKLYNLNLEYFKRDTKANKSGDDIAEAICLGLAYIKDVGRINDGI